MEIKLKFISKLKYKKQKCLGLMKERGNDKYIIYIDKDQPILEMIATFIHEVTHLCVSAFFKNEVCVESKEEKLCRNMEKAAKKAFKVFLSK